MIDSLNDIINRLKATIERCLNVQSATSHREIARALQELSPVLREEICRVTRDLQSFSSYEEGFSGQRGPSRLNNDLGVNHDMEPTTKPGTFHECQPEQTGTFSQTMDPLEFD